MTIAVLAGLLGLIWVCGVIFGEGAISFVGVNRTDSDLRVHGVFWPSGSEPFPYGVGDRLSGEFGDFRALGDFESAGYATFAPGETRETFFVYHGFSNRSLTDDDDRFVFLAVDLTNEVVFRADYTIGELREGLPDTVTEVVIADDRVSTGR